jgi:uroporphyrinogen-III synthase
MADNPAPLILLIRPRAQPERFAAMLNGLAEVRIIPLMEVIGTGARPDVAAADALIFTSENGVLVFAAICPRRDLPAWCVGDRTAEVAAGLGMAAHSAAGTANDLVAMLTAARPTGRILHLHGLHTRGDVAARLRDAGINAEGLAIYDQRRMRPAPDFGALLTGRRRVMVPLFSPRSARIFAEEAGGEPPPAIRAICLSDAVRAALPPAWQAGAAVCAHPDAPAMISAIGTELSP